METRKIVFALFLLLVAISLSAQDHAAMQMDSESAPRKAICVLYGTSGNDVSGIITFTKSSSGILVEADVRSLAPGKHGFHIHEFGDCSAADGTSAGGHFNPGHMTHGGPDDAVRHEGDLGNLEADETGRARVKFVDPSLSLSGPHSIIGYSVIVHAQEDDLVSQPTGNSGARVACGVIGIAK